MRREGRPSEQAILSGRVVDRTIRPLFPQHIRNEVQVVITVLALDEEDPDMVAVNAASLALATSDIPWGGPVAAVRIGKITVAKEILSSTRPIRARRRTLDILACGKDGTINMIEVGAKEGRARMILRPGLRAVTEHDKILEWQKQIIAKR
jgi:polyribonucleotide nucleotidyltransferase